ncbi:MAG: PqqD family protein [Pyrinomonadaceae bacterium]
MTNDFRPLARSKDLVVQEIPDELLIYDLNTDKAFCLNQTAALVWKNCDGQRNVAEIAVLLRDQTNSPVPDDLVSLAIDELRGNKLIDGAAPVALLPTKRMARRDAVRRIGLATGVILPLIATLSIQSRSPAVSCSGACTTLGQSPCNGSPSCTCLGTPGNLTCQ